MGQVRGTAALVLASIALAACDPVGSADAGAGAADADAADAGSSDAAPRDSGLRADGGPRSDGGRADAGVLPPGVAHSYTEATGAVGGPERGFYRYVELTSETDLSWITEGGHRLVFSYVRLDDFRDGPIGAGLLADLRAGLERARSSGLSVILRFAYNEGPYPDSEPDASRAIIESHIAQLAPIFESHADVIALVQAGFIGAWGEWHTSTNGLLDDAADRRVILEALVDALPVDRATQIRYPSYKEEMYGTPAAQDAFDGSYASRVGHHNDCFLSSETDVGTYPDGEVERWRSYVADDTRWVPMGGETCAPYPSRSDCAPALAEMERLHFSYINEDYHPSIVSAWRDQGCYETIASRIGYRLALRTATFAEVAPPGGRLALELTLENTGWAAPMNPRPLRVTLSSGSVTHEADAHPEVRAWGAGQTQTLRFVVELPGDLADGVWSLELSLPPSRASARADARLPFANTEFSTASGRLPLGAVTIDVSARGDRDASRPDLRLTALD